MIPTTTYVVLQHQEDGRYFIGDAVDGRVWTQRRDADAQAEQLTAERRPWAPTGYVVRGLEYVRQGGAHITNGSITRDVPCTCPHGAARIATCAYHA